MVSTPLRIDDLTKIITDHARKLDMDEYARKCMSNLETYEPAYKVVEISEKAKAEGNNLFAQKNLNFVQLYKILALYNESIAFAPNGSEELAAAYANKSAVLLRMRKYGDAITEIDRAIKITKSMSLKTKMFCRKTECLTALGSPDNRRCLEKAKFTMAKVEDSEDVKLKLNKLIEKAQTTIDTDKLNIPKEEKKRTQASEMIEEVERRHVSESIRVEYSKNYGRHLVAARNYKPGEIILVDKPYFSNLDDSKAHQYCDRCFNHLWTALPCEHCVRRLYCSEKCKVEAWNEHHELECSAISFMRGCFATEMTWYIPFVTSVFCKALIEAGSIKQLAADLESSSQCKGSFTESGSIMDFTSYKSIFTLPVLDPQMDDLDWCVENSIAELVGLANYTTILGRTYDVTEMKKLKEDEKAILLCALLLHFNIVLRSPSPSANLIDPNEQNDQSEEGAPGGEKLHKCLALMIMHTLSGCIPNVDCFATYGNNFILCALRPIKAGDKLILHPKSKSIWHKATTPERKLFYSKMYGYTCDCQACAEDWSDLTCDTKKLWDSIVNEMHCSRTLRLWKERNSILADWEANCLKPNFPDIKILSRAMNLVAVAWEQLKMPSAMMYLSVLTLMKILLAFYDPSEIYVKVPHLRPQTIGGIFNPEYCPPKSN